MDNQNNENRILIEDQKRLTMTGVASVDGFSEQYLKLTVNGKKITVSGDNIKITSFNKNNGTLTADGVFNSLKVDGAKTSISKKLFK